MKFTPSLAQEFVDVVFGNWLELTIIKQTALLDWLTPQISSWSISLKDFWLNWRFDEQNQNEAIFPLFQQLADRGVIFTCQNYEVPDEYLDHPLIQPWIQTDYPINADLSKMIQLQKGIYLDPTTNYVWLEGERSPIGRKEGTIYVRTSVPPVLSYLQPPDRWSEGLYIRRNIGAIYGLVKGRYVLLSWDILSFPLPIDLQAGSLDQLIINYYQ